VEFSILGALAVSEGDRDLPVPGTRLRTLLALLLVAAGETVTPDRLADDLWGDAIPAGSANALQSLVSKLRRTLGPAGTLVVTEPFGYRLAVDGEDVDARRFEHALATGRVALDDGDAATAGTVIADALALWRGPALDGLADNGALRSEALRLEELRVAALEDRGAADLECGRHAELVPELQQLTLAHPVRERFHGQLMVALYRCGRQAEALRAYQDARTLLADELGLDPGPELQQLEAAILAQDRALTILAPAARAATATVVPRVGGTLSRFVGRAAELADVGALVRDHRLVTVVGAGGAGKTRLSIEVAGQRPAGEPAWLVELATVTDQRAVAGAVAGAVGAADGILVGDGSGGTAMDRVIQFIGARSTLLVLDNCEHVIDEAARVAESLLVGCPNLRILATSREALAIGGETVWPIPALAIDDAVELFADRAGATSSFVLDEASGVVVAEVCDRLDGLPLAVELAAGRVRAIPIGQLASRLDDRFKLLTGGARTALPRQQTLRAVVEWSYDLLFDDERRVFERLSVFIGGCSLEAAETVCGGDDIDVGDVADLLTHLVDKSLVTVTDTGGVARFDLLQTLALYGRERLQAADDLETTSARHAEFFGQLCARGDAAFRGRDQVAWLREVQREQGNLRVALGWVIDRGDAQTAVTMLGGLGWSWWFSGRGREGWQWFLRALELPGETDPKSRATAAMWAGFVGANAGQGIEAAMVLADEAVAAFRRLDDQRALGDATMLLASIAAGSGRNEEAIARFDEAGALYAGFTDDFSRAVAANAAGRSAWVRGELELADRLQRESVRHFKAAGVEWANALVNDDIAVVAEMRGDIPAAIEGTQGARDAARYLGLRGAEAVLIARLGNYALTLGDSDEATRLHLEAIALAEEVGFNWARGMALNGRAMCCRAIGELDTAVACAEEAREIYRAAGVPPGEVLALASLGFVAAQRGNVASARWFHDESLALAREMDDPRSIALAYEGLAGVATLEADGDRAAMLLGAAQALRAQVGGAPAGPASDVDAVTATTRGLMDDDAYAVAFERGAEAPMSVAP
jgi:predicted ATPase/DNA-binding SARP family transcriptional activator